MQSVLVANPKGGSGKTTLATNLAGYLASARQVVCLWDLDRQHSALEWLRLRPGHLTPIHRLDERDAAPRKAEWLVLDSPAGLHGKRLSELLKQAAKVLVPIQPSVFDIAATRAFLAELAEEKAVRKQRTFVGVVGMRVDPRTPHAARLLAARYAALRQRRVHGSVDLRPTGLAERARGAVLAADRGLAARGLRKLTR
jgi:chromosome partitioning protein